MFKKIDKMSLILALLPIVGIYSIAGINISNFTLIMLVLYGFYRCIFVKKRLRCTSIDKTLIVFYIYTMIISVINLMTSTKVDAIDVVTKYIHLFCFISIIVLFRKGMFKNDLSIKPFIDVALIASCFLILQFVLFNFAGIKLYGVLEAYHTNITDDITRPSSFFVEPAHFCRYCSLPLYFLIFKDDSDNKIFKIILISLAILLSKSSIGYITFAVIWLFWLLKRVRDGYMKIGTVIKGMLIVIPSIIVAVTLSFKYELFSFVSDHVAGLNMTEITSGNVRVFRGFFIWFQEGFISKFSGVGFANVKSYLISNGIRTIFDGQLETGNEYMSAISYILVMSGIVGMAIFLFALVKVYLKGNNRILVVLLLVLMASNEEFMTVDFMNIWLFLLLSLDFIINEKWNKKIAVRKDALNG